MPGVTDLAGAILLLETSEEVPAADEVKRWVRALGERGSSIPSPASRWLDHRSVNCTQPSHPRMSALDCAEFNAR
jgi:hypothetical protein